MDENFMTPTVKDAVTYYFDEHGQPIDAPTEVAVDPHSQTPSVKDAVTYEATKEG